jgi:hypothetical protein
VGKPEGKRPLGRPRRRWMDNIKIDLRGIGWGRIFGLDREKVKRVKKIGQLGVYNVHTLPDIVMMLTFRRDWRHI